LLGSPAGLSPATGTRLTKQWQDDHIAFQQRDLADSDYVYVWAVGARLKIGLGQAHSCVLALMGVRLDGTKGEGTRRGFPHCSAVKMWVAKARNVTNALPKSAQPGVTKAM
jgi:putative transposase